MKNALLGLGACGLLFAACSTTTEPTETQATHATTHKVMHVRTVGTTGPDGAKAVRFRVAGPEAGDGGSSSTSAQPMKLMRLEGRTINLDGIKVEGSELKLGESGEWRIVTEGMKIDCTECPAGCDAKCPMGAQADCTECPAGGAAKCPEGEEMVCEVICEEQDTDAAKSDATKVEIWVNGKRLALPTAPDHGQAMPNAVFRMLRNPHGVAQAGQMRERMVQMTKGAHMGTAGAKMRVDALRRSIEEMSKRLEEATKALKAAEEAELKAKEAGPKLPAATEKKDG